MRTTDRMDGSLYRAAAYTNVGLRKKTNQDSCCAEIAETPYGDVALLSVCDGVGGLSAGELASSTVIHWLVDWFELTFSTYLATADIPTERLLDMVEADWEEGLSQLNHVIRNHGRSVGARLGTTCTVMLMIKNRYLIAHVGDCRVYRFAGNQMGILTVDQTWVAREVARGNITPAQARNHHRRNVILQSVGTQTDLQTVFYRGDVYDGDVYMLCCDGFRNEIFDDELMDAYALLSNASEEELSRANELMAEKAMKRGELDNITVVVCTYREGTNCSPTKAVGVADGNASPATVLQATEQVDATTRLDIPFPAEAEAGEYRG